MDAELDVAIVGGGPAGIATALFLLEGAVERRSRIVVLEKEAYPREKICAGAIGGRADRLLGSIGVRVEVPSAEVRALEVTTSRGASGARSSSVIGRVVRRIEFDHALAEIARARGIRIEEGARVTKLEVDRRAATLETTKGPIRARVVVGADGVGSFVRRAIGAPRGRWLAQVVEVDTEPTDRDAPGDALRFQLTDPTLYGYGWDFPTIVGGRRLVCRGLYDLRRADDDSAARDVDDLGARLSARLAELGVTPVGPVKRFAERGLAIEEPVARPRVLLVGEAAGIDPALGEGIAQAIFYGSVAGPYLASRLRRDALSFEDFPRVVARSRVGLDLRVRAAVTPWLYGRRSRPAFEAWVAGSKPLAMAGLHYFAGNHVPRGLLARAAMDLPLSGITEILSSRRSSR